MYVSFIRCTDIVFPTCKLEYTFPNRTFYRCIAIDVDNVLEEFEDVLLFLFFESVCGVSMRHRHAETATAISVINIKWRPRKLSSLFSDKIKYDKNIVVPTIPTSLLVYLVIDLCFSLIQIVTI